MTPLVAEGRNGTPPGRAWGNPSRKIKEWETNHLILLLEPVREYREYREYRERHGGGVGEVSGAEGVCLGCKGRRLRVRVCIYIYVYLDMRDVPDFCLG